MKTFITLSMLLAGIMQVHALVISEIMYDPEGTNTGRWWIEVFNDTGSAVNLTTWKFFEAGVNHSIVASQGGATLPADTYAVIADNPTKFLTDYPTYGGILYDSSFSLTVSGEEISLKETSSSVPVSVVDYTPYLSFGGDNDGSTLSLISSSWVRSRATPGALNAAEAKTDTETTTGTSTSTTGGNQATIAQMSPPSPDIVFYMPKEKLAIAGAETELKVSGLTRAGKQIDNLRFTWAFGDGGRGTGSTTKHVYVYGGNYIAQVEGSNEYVAGIGRMTVRVMPPEISIAGAGEGKYGTYVDVKNPNKYDLDVSGWAISIDGAVYPFPQNTIIAANTTTRFAGAAMGFANTPVREGTIFKIQFPNLEEVTRFIPASLGQVAGVSTSSVSAIQSTTSLKTTVYKSAPKKLVVAPEKVATSSSTPLSSVSKKESKDRRLVSWLKSLFGKYP